MNEPSQGINAPGPGGKELGILLVGHGTREERGVAEFFAVSERVTANFPEATVEACFLELCSPSIPEGLHRLLDAGVKRIVVSPLLLFAARHARCDIPQLVARSLEKIPGMVWEQAQHLGNHPAILQQSAARFQEAVMSRQPIASEQTLLVLVGRGSTDEQAIQAMHEFAAAAPQAARAVRTMVCFYAMASPSLDETLERAARAGCRRVVVQPHLLFEGQIAERIRESVRVAQLQRPEIEWIVANPLGPTELVAQAVAGRAKNPSCPPVNSPGLPQDEPRDGNQTKALKVAF